MKLIKLLLTLVVLLVVALIVAGFFIDGIAKTAIETAGTQALGVETRLDKAHVGLLKTGFSLSGLEVDNPKDAGEGQFLKLGEGSIAVSARSLMEDVVTVPEFTLKNIDVNLIKTATGSNYETILDNLEKFQGSSGGTSAPSSGGESASSEEGGKRFIINKLLIENVNVRVQPSKELNLAEVTVPIDRIELKDIGSESDQGVLLSDLAGIVIESILKKASVSGQLPNMIKGALDGKLGNLHGLKDAGAKALDDLMKGGVPNNPGEAVDGLKKKLGDGLKGLPGFGR